MSVPAIVALAILSQEPFEWSASRRLSWSDYLGRPDLVSPASALTAYEIAVEHGCTRDTFSFRVTVKFQPGKSWTKSTGQRLLEHEQGHFDLGEVHARRLRRAFRSVKDPCEMPASELTELAAKFILEDAERQQRYDRETIYGLNGRSQGAWDDEIRKQLKELATFAEAKG